MLSDFNLARNIGVFADAPTSSLARFLDQLLRYSKTNQNRAIA
ncbi:MULTISPECIES: hypothetical protein [Crocosphaera]|uniref:Uncharacterized protein n=5 Tax=Crocosphaera watsonii TaxID=263511 RepID=T2JWP9_CROWT|nr:MULTISPECIES: hypothetical protein [Crocosphaera]EHJ13933.1 hypothetical protein CWATWH0003_1381 [Crocosphaera watsonii WH 0003]CCQ50394.1 hypothetical protein CWATWH8502_525 [Crocosphaera watsonii WH 8502]CCQ57911.1 hypothetical protein CWATWH0005_4033 [Crocosphaera watsonii WH 0005]CCQ61319.1 hypothetical protein CWATWH0401_4013 [Crocosphaera watsonii WH 0401]CCQ69640.1 hypothetical protein CWATWH0402_2720 [Crocosphaera watsonii WH 0402]